MERHGSNRVAEGAATAPGQVLVADDNAPSRTALVRMLAGMGIAADAAADAGEAAAMAFRRRYDLVLLESRMPGLDSMQAAVEIRAARPAGCAIVAMSGEKPGEDHQRLLDGGIDDVLRKPVGRQALEQALRRWLRV